MKMPLHHSLITSFLLLGLSETIAYLPHHAHDLGPVRVGRIAVPCSAAAREPGTSEPKTPEKGNESKLTSKRKVAVVVGFDGSKYYGSQINMGSEMECPTVEGRLWAALIKAGLVLESNAVDPKKVAFSSASRVDRGVSAALFVVVAKLECPNGGPDDGGFDEAGRARGVTCRINEALNGALASTTSHPPSDITCFSVCKVTGKFRPRHCCNWREYEYLLPRSVLGLPDDAASYQNMEIANDNKEKEASEDSVFSLLQSALSCFTGTHNWANFCKAGQVSRARRQQHVRRGDSSAEEDFGSGGHGFSDSANGQVEDTAVSVDEGIRSSVYACEVMDRNLRVMAGSTDISGAQSAPKTVGMVRIRILGQSFFYNQIRQMIGAALCVATGAVRGGTNTLTYALQIPLRLAPRHYDRYQQALFVTAPAAGLLLVDSGFDRHPKMSIATTGTNAARLADPPKFVLLDENAEAKSDAWRSELYRRIGTKWMSSSSSSSLSPFKQHTTSDEPSESSTTCLADRFTAQLASFSATEEMEADLKSLWRAWQVESNIVATEADRVRDEASRRASMARSGAEGSRGGDASLGQRRYRSMLPKGFATALATHCRLPPGRLIADVQRGLCENMIATAATAGAASRNLPRAESSSWAAKKSTLPPLSPTASTADILQYVDIVGVEALAQRGQEQRSSSHQKANRKEPPDSSSGASPSG